VARVRPRSRNWLAKKGKRGGGWQGSKPWEERPCLLVCIALGLCFLAALRQREDNAGRKRNCWSRRGRCRSLWQLYAQVQSPGGRSTCSILRAWNCLIAQIHATDWEVRTDGPLKKVTVELWEWPGGKILELSAKADPQKGASTMGQLREMAVASGLTVEEKQDSKTSLVLHAAVR